MPAGQRPRSGAVDARGPSVRGYFGLGAQTARLSQTVGRAALGPALLVACWELASRQEWLYRPFFPPPSEIVLALPALLPTVTEDLRATLARTLVGLAIGAAIGLALGIATSQVSTLRRTLVPIIEFLRPLPTAAIIPLVVMQFGYGPRMYAFAVSYSAAWPVYIAAYESLRGSDLQVVRVARSLGIEGLQLLLRVKLRLAGPAIAAGMRVSIAFALIVTVVAEMLFGQSGLGFQLTRFAFGGRMHEYYALALLVSLAGVALNLLFVTLNRRVQRWHEGYIALSS